MWKECIEILVAASPAVVALILATRHASQMPAWFMHVVGTSFLALLSVGLVLSRLTRTCDLSSATCPDNVPVKSRQPGIFSECYTCEAQGGLLNAAGSFLNSWSFSVQLLAAIVSILASVFTTARFIAWARRVLQITRARGTAESPSDS